MGRLHLAALIVWLVTFHGCVRAGFGPFRDREASTDGSGLDDQVTDGTGQEHLSGGRGAFVVFGLDGRRAVSFDQGATWPVDQQDVPATGGWVRALSGAAWGNGVVVIVGGTWYDPGAMALRSTEGTAWTEYAVAGGQGPLGLAFGNGVFVSMNNGGDLYTSNDGVAWTYHGGGGEPSRGICYGQGRFFSAGDSGTLATSPDGVAWRSNPLGGGDLYGVACGTDRFVTTGEERRVVTLDGLTVLRDERVTELHKASGGLAFGEGVFVDQSCSTSTDGLTWAAGPAGCPRLHAIAYGEGVFLALGDNMKILRSDDRGRSWQEVSDRPTSPEVWGVRYVRFP